MYLNWPEEVEMLEGHAFPIESRLLLRMLNKIPGKQFDIYLVNEMLQRAKKAFEENGRMGEPDIAIEEGDEEAKMALEEDNRRLARRC